MRKLLLTAFAFFCSTAPAQASTAPPQQADADNPVNKRIVRIQQQLAREKTPAALDDIRVSQWVNFPNWPNWNNWNNWNNNWNNWYNY